MDAESASGRTPELAAQVRGLILIRLLVMTVFAALLWGAAKAGSLGVAAFVPFGLLAAVWALTLFYWAGLRVGISLPFLVGVQIALDLVLATTVIAGTGGTDSPFVILYFLTIFTAGMLRERRGAIPTAVGAGAAFAAVAIFEPGGGARARMLFEIGTHGGAFVLLAFLSGLLARRHRRSREELESATEELQRVLSSTDRIMELMPIGLITASPDGRILRWNRAALSILGLPENDPLVGRDVRGLFSVVAPQIVDALESALATRRWAIREEIVVQKDEEKIPIGVAVTPLVEPEDRLEGVIVTLTDLQELRRMEREMFRAEQLAALGELAANVAHEIRNPLASISGAVQVLRAEVQGDGEDAELMDLIVNESDRLNRIIDGVLDYTRDHSLSLEIHDLSATVAEVVRLLRHDQQLTIGKTVLVELPDDQSFLAEVEEGGMRQVFFNLARNALEAMSVGGILRITGQNTGDGRLFLVFRDTGEGIAPQELDRIFEPFRTSKVEGTGLGLSIASRIVEGNGGAIRVKSTPGVGTAVTVELPAAGEIPGSSALGYRPKEEDRTPRDSSESEWPTNAF